MFGRVASSSSVPGRGRGKARTELRVTDGSGYLRITFFNQPWRARQLPEGSEAMFFGKVTEYRGQKQLANPEIDLLDEADRLEITPIYPQSDKARLYSRDFRGWLAESLRRADELRRARCRAGSSTSTTSSTAAPPSPASTRPETMAEAEEARRRLVFDELLRIQLALVLRKRQIETTSQGIEHVVDGALVERFLDALPFELTDDQRRVIGEIRADLARPIPMHRLLQGDVGSGKTVVAMAALLTAVQGGHQGAFMAPTEVLAEQHHRGIWSRCWRASRCPTRERRSSATGPSPWSCSPTGSPARSGSGSSARWPRARSTCSSAPTPSSRRRSSSAAWAWPSSTSSTASASSSAPRSPARRRATWCPTCW